MKVSKRLKNIAKEIYYEKICDIGADHCHLSIYAYYIGKIKKSISCDISKNAIEKGIKNIKKYSYENYIETRVGEGLSKIRKKEADTIVLSGMGGYNIIKILEKNNELTKEFKQIIIQPQSGIKEVRKYIHKIDFKIINEEFVKDNNKYYNIINCIKGIEEEYKEIEYILGKILLQKKEKLFLDYIKDNMIKTEKILNKCKYKNYIKNKENIEKIKFLEKKLSMFKEVLKYNDKM